MGLFEKFTRNGISGTIRKGENFDEYVNLQDKVEGMGIKPEDSGAELCNNYIENISKDLLGYLNKSRLKFDDKKYYKMITERANEIHVIAKEMMELSEHDVEKILNSKNQNDVHIIYDKMGKAIEILEHFRSDLSGEPVSKTNPSDKLNENEIRRTLEDTAIMLMKLDVDIRSTIEPVKSSSSFNLN